MITYILIRRDKDENEAGGTRTVILIEEQKKKEQQIERNRILMTFIGNDNKWKINQLPMFAKGM